jgi:hypothetical protein
MHDQFIAVRIAELRHPADRRLDFFHFETDAAFFQRAIVASMSSTSKATVVPSRDGFQSGWQPTPMVVGPRSYSTQAPSIAAGGRLQFERLLIKFPRSFFVRNSDGDKCYFFDHKHSPFSFSGFNLWIINLLPSGSCTTAM